MLFSKKLCEEFSFLCNVFPQLHFPSTSVYLNMQQICGSVLLSLIVVCAQHLFILVWPDLVNVVADNVLNNCCYFYSLWSPEESNSITYITAYVSQCCATAVILNDLWNRNELAQYHSLDTICCSHHNYQLVSSKTHDFSYHCIWNCHCHLKPSVSGHVNWQKDKPHGRQDSEWLKMLTPVVIKPYKWIL